MSENGSSGVRSMAALIAELASRLPDVTVGRAGGAATWSRAGVAFATLDGDALELRLDARVAAAAVRTPGTSASPRGAPWVRFAPDDLDAHAVDRATAWFGLAYRRAGES